MNILITGSNGQLGTEMRTLSAEHPKHQYFFTDVIAADGVQTLDITDKTAGEMTELLGNGNVTITLSVTE